MRKKQRRLVVTFHTTTGAIEMERYCLNNAVPGRLIPVPREISAGCGMAWSAPPEAREQIENLLREMQYDFQELHELEI